MKNVKNSSKFTDDVYKDSCTDFDFGLWEIVKIDIKKLGTNQVKRGTKFPDSCQFSKSVALILKSVALLVPRNGIC